MTAMMLLFWARKGQEDTNGDSGSDGDETEEDGDPVLALKDVPNVVNPARKCRKF